ncbi:MAG: hypothetical protein ACYSWP_18280 [Planctomycetota bacterium]
MGVKKQLQYLWNYKWSSLPGYVALMSRLDFVEYNTVLTEHGGRKYRIWVKSLRAVAQIERLIDND